MAISIMNTNNIVILGIIGILVFCGGNNKNVVAGQQCKGDTQGLITECGMYVYKPGHKVKPSKSCCDEIKSFAVSDASCLCKHLPNAALQFIDMQKVIYVAKSCGKPIPSGTKCGGVTVP